MGNNSLLGKISIVVFLTVLIWVWADMAQDERLALSNVVSVGVARSSDPALWLTFVDEEGALRSTVTVDNVDLKGPASTVADIERMRNKGELDLALFLVPEREGFTEAGTRTLDVLNFLKQSDAFGQLGLTAEGCEPRTLTVQVRRLVEKSLPIECVDDRSGAQVKAEVEPAEVSAFGIPDETIVARVRLTASEQSQARESAIEKTPFVELAPGQRRDVGTSVKIKLSPAEDVLRDENVQATLGFCFSPNLQGRYRVELQNETDLVSTILKIKATPAAKQAYEQQPFKIFLYILDDDPQATNVITRRVGFNFPEEYVSRGEIRADEQAPEARFRLVPIPTPAPAPPGS